MNVSYYYILIEVNDYISMIEEICDIEIFDIVEI